MPRRGSVCAGIPPAPSRHIRFAYPTGGCDTPMPAYALAGGGFMIMASSDQIRPETGHDHGPCPLYLNLKLGHNGYNGPHLKAGLQPDGVPQPVIASGWMPSALKRAARSSTHSGRVRWFASGISSSLRHSASPRAVRRCQAMTRSSDSCPADLLVVAHERGQQLNAGPMPGPGKVRRSYSGSAAPMVSKSTTSRSSSRSHTWLSPCRSPCTSTAGPAWPRGRPFSGGLGAARGARKCHTPLVT